MAKFKTGFLIGAAAGCAYALLTSKRTGAQRQADFAGYVDDLTHATTDVQHAVKRFSTALTAVRREAEQTLRPAISDIHASVSDFEFQTQPRLKAIDEHLAVIEQATAKHDH